MDGREPGPSGRIPAAEPPGPDRNVFEIVWQSPWVRAFVYVVLIVLVVWTLWALREGYAFALQVGVIGFVIAYILNPVVEALRRARLPRPLAVVIVYVVLLNLLVLGSVLVAQVVTQLTTFIGQIPEALERIAASFAGAQARLQGVADNLPGFLSNLSERFGIEVDETGDGLAQDVQEQIQGVLTGAARQLVELLQNLLERGPGLLVSGATSIISTTLQVFLILIASAYFLYDFPRFTTNFRRFVPLRYRDVYSDLATKTDRAVGGYLRGQLLITAILGVMIYIGLSILQIPLALAISFLAAIFNLVPYLGPIIGVIPAVLLGFTVSPLTGLLAVLVFVVANQLEGNVLSPMILSKSVDLHPVTVLLAITVGLGLLGFVGALLAVPVVALVKLILEEYLLDRPAYVGPVEGPPEGPPDREPLEPPPA